MKLSTLLPVALICTCLVGCKPAEKPILAQEFAAEMVNGWNLGNSMDAANDGIADETGWGNPACTQQTMDRLYELGFRSVRIPTTWVGHIGAAPEYTLDAAWLARVDELVGMAEKAGLKAIVNIHHDGNPDVAKQNYWLDPLRAAQDEAYNTELKAELYAVWVQIAEQLNHYSNHTLLLEALNEIHDGNYGNSFTADQEGQLRVLNEWMQVFVDAVRSTGGNNADRCLAVTSYYAKPRWAVEGLELPNDPAENRLLVAVHSYDPWYFAGTAEQTSWGKHSPYGTDEEEIDRMMESLYNKWIKNGVPVYMGEFGAVHQITDDARAEQYRYLGYFVKTANRFGIPCLLWDNGVEFLGEDAFGFINHGTGAWAHAYAKPAINAILDK